MVAPAMGFYSTPNTGTNQVRIMRMFLILIHYITINCLDFAIKTYPGRTK